MARREIIARQALASQGIYSPRDLALWARRRGLLSVYVEYIPPRTVYPACWQIVRPGARTDPKGPAWQRGNKTFIVRSINEKHRFEDAARTWAAAQYDVDRWVRIEGLGGSLFPQHVAEELRRYAPDLVFYRKRQHTARRAREPASRVGSGL